ncbi:MAG: DUF4292 domain-containing protein [Sphingobacteriales bacterium]|nr:MAG: DUF4292 domain-containing protein [Sphingobacteriales bacterium]
MNKIPKHFLLFTYMVFFVGFISCKRTKNITKTETPTPTVDNLKGLREQVSALEHNYNWLRMRSDVNYKSADDNYSVNASFRIKKNELIWSSVTMLIEAARMQITNDSAVILNRLQKEYAVLKSADLQKMLAIEGLDVKALQKLLLAQPPFGIRDGSKLTNTENAYTLQFQNASYKEEMDIDAKGLYLNKYRFERNATQYITVNYSNFTQVQDKFLPQKIVFDIASPQKILITLDVSDYTFTETDDAPFSVPQGYKKSK